MKPVKEDAKMLLRTARKQFREAKSLNYVGYDSKQGHVWIIQDEKGGWLARGWFGPDGEPRFARIRENA